MKDFFCHLPFFAINTDGVHAKPCCKVKLDNPVPLEHYVYSDEIIHIKQLLLNNQIPHQCNTCVVSESISGVSLRTLSNQFNSHLSNEAMTLNSNQFDIRFVDLVGSNACNLMCLPCEHGSFIRSKELYELGLFKFFPVIQKSSWDTVAEMPIEMLTITSGEPFYNKDMLHLINQLIENGHSKQIRIDINTNLTHITQEILELLVKNFKSVLIKGSIDGIGAVNDYLRYPSKWATIEKNVKLIQSYPEINFVVTTALSNLSLVKYYEVVQWALDNNIVDMFISQVTSPVVLDCNLLPIPLKEKLLIKYQNLQQSIVNTASDRVLHCLDICIALCQNHSSTNLEFKNTLNWIKLHDDRRCTSMLDVFSELADFEYSS